MSSRHAMTGRCMIGIAGVESRSLPSGFFEVVYQVTYSIFDCNCIVGLLRTKDNLVVTRR
jgi:hypothetical protein